MDQRLIELYDQYTHAPLPRRVFLRRLAALTGSTAAANAALPLLENNHAQAAVLPAGDPRIDAVHSTYPGASGPVRAYVARPRGSARLPAVIVVHENRGLNAHIEDVARRVAVEGYVALAPDLLSSAGGTPGDEDKAREMISKLPASAAISDLVAAVAHLRGRQDTNGRVGCVGFCWGGAMANNLAVHAADLGAAVAYYGRQPAAEDAKRIRAALLLHYAGLDEPINKGIEAYEAALKQAGTRYTLHVYPGVNHAFNNDTAAARYNKEAADLAWRRTIDFFNAHLKSPA